jgi:hypothetical protein
LPPIGRVGAGQQIDANSHLEREIAVDRFLLIERTHFAA